MSTLLLSVGALLCLILCGLPFASMVVTSFSKPDTYQTVLTQLPFFTYLRNSVCISLVVASGQLFLGAMAGYAFARLRFKGQHTLWWLVASTMMIPPQVNLIPLFLLTKTAGAVDTYWALIVPGLFSAASAFFFKQWFSRFPTALEEAAQLDGCSLWQQFWYVALPAAQPALWSMGLLSFVGSWNGFLWPLTVTFSDAHRTLPIGIAVLKQTYRDTMDWPVWMAAVTLSILPLIVLYLMAQKPLRDGMLGGSVKE